MAVLALAAWAALILAARGWDARLWNRGYCECGRKWLQFDTDSQGGRGYKCERCSNCIWISWGVDGR